MNRSPFLQMALLGTCVVTILSGCVYNDRKAVVLNEREYLQAMATEEKINNKELIEENKYKKNEKDKIINDIYILKKNKESLQLKLKKIQIAQAEENKLHSVQCGEKCQEVKKLEKNIKELGKSIKEKESALKVM